MTYVLVSERLVAKPRESRSPKVNVKLDVNLALTWRFCASPLSYIDNTQSTQ